MSKCGESFRIVSDGTANGTKILQGNEDVTEELGVQSIVWSVKAGDLSKATLKLRGIAVDVTGQVETHLEDTT